MERFDPESIDLAALATHLQDALSGAVVGSIVGRTHIRDAAAAHVGCSQLEAEQLVDTMVGRGFLVSVRTEDGLEGWTVRVS